MYEIENSFVVVEFKGDEDISEVLSFSSFFL